MKNLSIAKFGGTSVADFSSMQACANIIFNNKNIKVAVLSASAGVTNYLVKLANGCKQDRIEDIIQIVKNTQDKIINKIPNNEAIKREVENLIQYIYQLSKKASIESSLELTDQIISHGELISTIIFIEILKLNKIDAVWIDARDIITTDNNFGKASPNLDLTIINSKKILEPILSDNKVIVTQGFIGSTSDHKTTTLGRGGSDYSAALFGEILNANEVLIWTDVAGIYTIDPRMVKEAKRLDELSFCEASEMATFGAKVLHPATLLPAIRKNIPVFVGSTKQPELGGTWVIKDPQPRPIIRAMAIRRNQLLITLRSLDMLYSYGFLNKIFAIIAKYKISIDTISTSEVSIALTIDQKGSVLNEENCLPKEMLNELNEICSLTIDKDLALIALIGNDMQQTTGVQEEIFRVVKDYKIRLISYGASNNNICFLVNNEDVEPICKKLHNHFFEKIKI